MAQRHSSHLSLLLHSIILINLIAAQHTALCPHRASSHVICSMHTIPSVGRGKRWNIQEMNYTKNNSRRSWSWFLTLPTWQQEKGQNTSLLKKQDTKLPPLSVKSMHRTRHWQLHCSGVQLITEVGRLQVDQRWGRISSSDRGSRWYCLILEVFCIAPCSSYYNLPYYSTNTQNILFFYTIYLTFERNVGWTKYSAFKFLLYLV